VIQKAARAFLAVHARSVGQVRLDRALSHARPVVMSAPSLASPFSAISRRTSPDVPQDQDDGVP
jgi:hypothetical protein